MRPERRLIGFGVLAGLAAVFAASCDLKVLNPSTISDEELDNPVVFQALVNGAAGDVGVAATNSSYGGLFVIGSLLTDELVAADNRQGPRLMSDGDVPNAIVEATNWWGRAARANWTTEHAIRRIGGLVDDSASNPLVAEATIWAGFSFRISGDAFCEAVINGGPLEPHTAFYERALIHFTSAIEFGERLGIDSLRIAGHAGRAQTRMMLGDWEGAVADAAEVPDDFQFVITNTTSGDRNRNRYWTYSRGEPRYLVWGTPFQEWGVDWSGDRTVGDMRVQYEIDRQPDGSITLGLDLRRPWYKQRKYTGTGNPIPLVKGTEMRLIEAEALLISGAWQAAIDKINYVREYRNRTRPSSWGTNLLEPVSAANEDEAWYLLMKERGIEMWLEGRRLPDLRRWAKVPGKEKVPFKVVRKEAPSANYEDDVPVSVYDVSNDLCFEVSLEEKLSNPNIKVEL